MANSSDTDLKRTSSIKKILKVPQIVSPEAEKKNVDNSKNYKIKALVFEY